MSDGVRLIVFGRQGAGKGTQAFRLAERYGVPHISTGDMLRAAAAVGTEFGLQAKTFMDAGQLLPDDVMLGVIEDRLAQADAATGWLLDGFPRTPGQAEGLNSMLGENGPNLAVNLDVPETVVIDRISGRRVCTSCGAIYSVSTPPQSDWTCDKCGGSVVQRDDDTEDAVRKRLAAYNSQTAPLLEWFEERQMLVNIDGVGLPDEVADRITSAVDSRLGIAEI